MHCRRSRSVRPASASRCATPSRRRSGSTTRRRQSRPTTADRSAAATCWSSVAGSPGCGLRCWPRKRTRTLDVVLLEGERIGWAALGRNGGFVSSSLTHGLPNGVDRFADELPTCFVSARRTSTRIEATLERYGIDAQWERNGEMTAAYESWQVDDLASYASRAGARRRGRAVGRRAHAGRGALTHLSRGSPRARRHCSGEPGAAGLGPGACRRESGRPHPRAEPGHRLADENGQMVREGGLRTGAAPRRWHWPRTSSRTWSSAPGRT